MISSSANHARMQAYQSISTKLACLVLGLFSLIVPLAAQTGPIVWTARSLDRIAPDAAAGNVTSVSIAAGKGEYESFQIVVKAPATGSLSNVNVSVADLIGPGGSSLPTTQFTLYREYYSHVNVGSPDIYHTGNRPLGPGWYPDGLIPFVDPSTGKDIVGATIDAVPFSVAPGKNQPLWVDVLVPVTATAGTYTGVATVTSDQGSATVPISVKVWNFTLPATPALKSSFSAHAPYNTDKGLAQLLLQNRLMPTIVDPANAQDLMTRLGLSTTNLWFFSEANSANCTMAAAPTVSAIQTQLARYPAGIAPYIYSADEIDSCGPNIYPALKTWAKNMHQANPAIKNLVTMTPASALFDDGTGTGRSVVDIWTMLPVMYDAGAAMSKQALAKGDSLWSYNALMQDGYSPKWLIDFAPINYRIQPGFISESLSFSGLLYWRVDMFSSDPWNNVEAYTEGGYTFPGEGMLFYPGAQIGTSTPAASMRLKYLRDGVDDYDYIELLKAAGWGDWALGVARSVGANWSNWTQDPAALEAARTALGNKLDELGGTLPKTCTYSLNSNTILVDAPAAHSTLTITTSAGCTWTATSSAPWITFGSPTAGTGSNSLVINVSQNSGAQRSGTVTAGAQSLVITQSSAAPACNPGGSGAGCVQAPRNLHADVQ